MIVDCRKLTPSKPILLNIKKNGNKYYKKRVLLNRILDRKPIIVHKGIGFSFSKYESYDLSNIYMYLEYCYKHTIIVSIFVNEQEELNNYRRTVKKITNKNKNKLYSNWDGYDYYDGKKIISNFNLNYNNPFYPTIDHKISIIEGFNKNIPPENIGDIKNLCITTKRHNSRKKEMCDESYSFLDKFKLLGKDFL